MENKTQIELQNQDSQISSSTKNYLYKESEKEQLKINLNHNKIRDGNQDRQIQKCIFNGIQHKTQILSIDKKSEVKIHDATTLKCLDVYKVGSAWLMSIDTDRILGNKIAVGNLDNKILIQEINPSKDNRFQKVQKGLKAELQGHQGPVLAVQFLSSNYLIGGSADSTVSLWDLENCQNSLATHQKHNGDVSCLSTFGPDPNIFLSASQDCTCKIWDIRVKNPVQGSFKGHTSALNTLKFLPASDPVNFATGSEDCTILLHDLRMQNPVSTFQDINNKNDAINSIVFSPSGRLLFGGCENNKLKVWDLLSDGQHPQNFDVGINSHIKCVDISKDGYGLVISGSEIGEISYVY